MKILDVPFRKQLLENSCFVSGVYMVLKYYGDKIDERKLYWRTIINDTDGAQDVKLAQFLIKRGYKVTIFCNAPIEQWGFSKNPRFIRSYAREYAKALRLGMKHKKNATVSLIKKFIDKNTPVLVEINADKFYGGKKGYSHILVILGYDARNLYFHDPHKDLGGKMRSVSIQKFRKAWEKIALLSGWDIGPSAGRSVTVIEPNNKSWPLRKPTRLAV